MNTGYAVIDTETTGLHPGYHHRIIELAIVRLDLDGTVTDEWCSLLNPERDCGPQSIHGISAAESRRAPTFSELAGHIANRLAGHVIVAHNLSFDLKFLQAEFRRASIDINPDYSRGLCTMRLATRFIPQAGRSLASCCRAVAIPRHNAHSALHDAHAAARLMAFYIQAAGKPAPWDARLRDAAVTAWPSLPLRMINPVRRRSPLEQQPDFLARLVDRLPSLPDDPRTDDYLAVLDSALIDRHLSESEQDELLDTASDLGLTVEEVVRLHRRYLATLASIAWSDGVLTESERADLQRIANLLGLTKEDVDGALTAAHRPSAHRQPQNAATWGQFRLAPGDLVVFTGETTLSREKWHTRAIAAGLSINGGTVTKKTKLVVAADPDSLSGKARKARGYGIPIVTESAFAQMLQELHLK